ncbi:SusC/RagA family TonB-linked outer membrane protein [Larkinella punicea]|uniref:TonB-dependent receptor n=1 Tax=Larkinella punicea TaxID=2315727 RepID=A0A368JMP6_9BACT|nr:TonB-dependent receptor [Larkinella punicea]RCR67843.1 TonB-dependent receptor [Larkinella punicea]
MQKTLFALKTMRVPYGHLIRAFLIIGLVGTLPVEAQELLARRSNPPAASLARPLRLQPATNRHTLPDRTITGKVSDEKGGALPGVNIVIKGTSRGTTTNEKGVYTLSIPNEATTLVFSFVGYLSYEAAVDNRSSLDVTLKEDAQALGEVVVVGYGTQRKVNVTGAIATVASKELVINSNNDVTNTLTGRAPGVRVVQLSSQPGKYDSQIDIRGFSYTDPNDINGNQTGGPLIIVDGVQRDKSGFDRLDPNEIESVSILKDATAAIYGVKAANGVVLVTTKKGSQGKVQVNYTTHVGQQIITKYPQLSNAFQYATLFNEQHVNNNISNRAEFTPPKYSATQLADFQSGKATSTDFLKAVLRDRASQQQHNLTINGGTDKLRYFASAGFFGEGGLFKSDILTGKKYNLRLNIDAELTKGLTMGANIALINSISNEPSQGIWALLKNTWQWDPTEPLYSNNDPAYLRQPLSALSHPIADFSEAYSGYNRNDEKFLTSTFQLSYVVPFVKGLSLKAQYAYDNNYSFRKQFTKKYNQYEYLFDAATQTYYQKPYLHLAPSRINEAFGQGKRNDVQLSFNYQNSFGKHNVGALGLYEQIDRVNNSHNASTQFIIDAVDQLAAGSRKTDAIGSGYSSSANMSYVGRVNYDYAGKYLVEAGFRYDGSSSFPKNSRWGFFPYVSAGWRISEEAFIRTHLPFISNLKLRGSYGVLGDDGISGASFQFLTGYTYPSSGYQFGTNFVGGLGFKNSANPNITWYTSTTTNFGLEGAFWNSLLTFEADVFRRDRDGLLGNRISTIPATYGVNLPQVNLNQDRTQGFEIVLGHRNKIRDVNYSISANMSYARTQYRYREETPANSDYDYWRNRNAGRFNDIVWGYKTDGQFQTLEEIRNAPIMDGAGNRTVLPGDIKYVDVNGDGIISNLDETVIGRGQSKPAIYFGTNLTVSWKGFDVSMLLQGATMYQVAYQDQLSRPFYFATANPISAFNDRWHRSDVVDAASEWIPGKYPSTGQRQNYRSNEFWRFDATYLRVKSLEVGYSLPKTLLSKAHIKGLRVFGNGYNLFTFSKGLDFVDPEYTDDRLYSYNYPLTMNVNLGLQLSF